MSHETIAQRERRTCILVVMRASTLLWVLVVSGCGDNLAVPDDGARSGARLKLSWYVFEDGPRKWVDDEVYFDTELGEDCRPYMWEDGTTRCVPKHNQQFQAWYADAECSVEVASASVPAVEMVVRCGRNTIARMRGIAGTVTVSTLWRRDHDGACVEQARDTDDPPRQPFEIGVVGDELDRARFAAIEISDPGDAVLAVRFHQSTDGMRLPVGVYHRDLGDSRVFDGAVRSVDYRSYVVRFTDPQCTERVIEVGAGCEPPVSTRISGSSHEIGAALAGSPQFVIRDGACVAETPPAEASYFTVGGVVPNIRIPLTIDTTDARLALRHYAFEDVVVRDSDLHDSELDVECYPRALPDGTTRCMPNEQPYVLHLYTDSLCQAPITVVELYAIPFLQPPRYAWFETGDQVSVYQVDDVYPKQTYTLANGVCSLYRRNGPLFTLGATIPLESLVAADVVTDP